MFSDNNIFKLWHDKGIMYFEQCYNNGTLMSFEQQTLLLLFTTQDIPKTGGNK